jgi:chromosome partitioning protein
MAEDSDLPAWANLTPAIAAAQAERQKAEQQAEQPGAAFAAANSNWDGVERRRADRGPPTGTTDRRQASPVFGRRATR